MTESDENFASRWSRRKRETQVQEPEQPPMPAGSQRVPAESGEAPASPAQPETPELPDIETLDADADFTVFLKDNVPETLRRRALRRLWRLNPVFANLDGLNDYDDDYTDAATVVEGLKTLYKVGKGFEVEEDEKPEEAEEPVLAEAGIDSDEAVEETVEPGRDPELPGDEAQVAQGQVNPVPIADKTGQDAVPETESHRRGALARRWGRADG